MAGTSTFIQNRSAEPLLALSCLALQTMQPRILLIEDDQSLAASFQKVLLTEGYLVAHSARGDQGLDLAVREAYDLVITDLRLPGLGGLDLVDRLHRAKPKLPVIL